MNKFTDWQLEALEEEEKGGEMSKPGWKSLLFVALLFLILIPRWGTPHQEPKEDTLYKKTPSHVVGRSTLSVDTINAEVNKHRATMGLQPLRIDEGLNDSALAKCSDMTRYDYWSHTSPTGKTPWMFIKESNTYQLAGENLAYGWDTPAELVRGWVGSKTHRENLERDWDFVGYGVCSSADYIGMGFKTIVVQHFKEMWRGKL